MSHRAALVSVLLSLGLGGITWGYAQQSKRSAAFSNDDYIAIQHLYARYNEAIDNGDADGWAAVWTADGDFNGFKGRDGLLRFAHDYLNNRDGARRRHWINNLVIRPTAEGAQASNYFMILDVSVTPPAVASTGRNVDTFVKTADGWRFTTRKTYRPDGKSIDLRPSPPGP
jgi:hypothetical protein